MTCKEFIDHLLDYTEGELDVEARRLCERHADLCRDCADYLKGYESTRELSTSCFDSGKGLDENFDLPEDLVQSILSAATPPTV